MDWACTREAFAEVVEATVGEDLGASLEPDGLAELNTGVLGEQLGGEAPEGAEHGPAGVDELGLAVGGEGLGIGGEAGGVPAVVAGELAGQVGGDIALGEGAEPLGAVGAVELDGGAGDLLGAAGGDSGLAGHGGGERAGSDGSHYANVDVKGEGRFVLRRGTQDDASVEMHCVLCLFACSTTGCASKSPHHDEGLMMKA